MAMTGIRTTSMVTLFTITAALAAPPTAADPARLVVQITVDGLRTDLLTRNLDRMGDDGFRRLLDRGTFYANAHYEHANTETIVGHSTLATGAQPAVHGMTGNVWYDSASGELSYNIEDPAFPLLPSRQVARKGDQVDPAQQLARTSGRSPYALLVPTIGDVISKSSAGRSKVFGISGKDRSAVAMAGQSGKSFWFSSDSGDFVTSSYYYDDYPPWVQAWNGERRAESFAGERWELLHAPETYRQVDDRLFERDLKGFGRTFPHTFGSVNDGLLPTQLLASPFGDQLLADFTRALIRNEQLGQDAETDYLSVSFSGIDAISHFFGPSSREAEDGMLQLDQVLASLFEYIDEVIGLKRTLIVLSADHGAAELPEFMSELHFDAERLTPDQIIERSNVIASERWQLKDVTRFYYRPYLYLDRAKIEAAGYDFALVRSDIATRLSASPGVHLAISEDQLDSAPSSRLIEQIRNNHHSERTGDIYVVQSPYWLNLDKGPIVGMHGSPWNYDTHVPIIIAGAGTGGRTIYRRVQPADVAPTISAHLGLHPPAAATGQPLIEALK